LESAGRPKKALYAVSKLATSNCIISMRKFCRVLKVMGRTIWLMGVAAALGTMPWKGAQLECIKDLDNLIRSKVFRNKMFRELPPSMRTQLSLTSLMMG
jgi:hypothetical protein